MLDPSPKSMNPDPKHCFFLYISNCLLQALQGNPCLRLQALIFATGWREVSYFFFYPPPSAFQVNLYPSEPAARICIYRLSYHTWIHTGGWSHEIISSLWEFKNRFCRVSIIFPLVCVFYCFAEREIENENRKAAMYRSSKTRCIHWIMRR
jgi:hypothetical protein